jgi:hypothetical protein
LINNRQNGRRRGRGGQRSQGGNPGRGPDNGNRIDNRARGNAAQLLEKYKTLARDAQMQGDRVNTEYYLQFADHYFRVLAETRSRFEENQPRRQNDQFDGDDGDDFDGAEDGVENANDGYRGNGRDRQERSERYERQDRPDRQERQDRSRDRAERDGNRIAANEDGEDDAPIAAQQGGGMQDRDRAEDRPRRGRPRRVANDPVALNGNGHDAAADSGALPADLLPPAIGAVSSDDDAPAEKPRRRRRVATADETSSAG